MKEPINKITLKDGSIRYRLVVDIGPDERGKRKQLTHTFDTGREAREELSRMDDHPSSTAISRDSGTDPGVRQRRPRIHSAMIKTDPA